MALSAYTVFQLLNIRTQSPSSHSLFSNWFTKSSGVYKRLGQFDYGQPNCTTHHIKTCIHKDNRWVYIGEVKEGTDDTEHGIGITVYSWGCINEGYWKDGQLDGRGRRIYDSGGYYIGELEGGNYNGEGTMYNCNGNKNYEGGWKDDKYNGQGTKYRYNGDKEYEGGWENGEYNGQGTRYYKDGDRYEGGWKNGGKHGQGTYYRNGDKYTGIWVNSFDGQGEINYKDGTKYKGQWDDYKRHGLGTLYSADGQVLNQGKWDRNKYEGKE